MGNIYISPLFCLGEGDMKKYLLLIEDEKLWGKFKDSIKKDINTEIMNLIRKKLGVEVKKDD